MLQNAENATSLDGDGSDDDYFLLIQPADSCFSYVGRLVEFARRGQPLSFNENCASIGVILHEVRHMILRSFFDCSNVCYS